MSERSPAQIEREVESTRANVEGTLDALRERLNPQQLIDQVTQQAMDYVRGSGGQEFMRNLGAGVRDNPLPVLLVGAGIAWMMLAPRRDEAPAPQARYQGPDNASEGLGQTASRLIGTAKVRVSEAVGQAGEVVRDAAEMAGDAAARVGHAVSDAASRTADAASEAVTGTASRLAGSAAETASGLQRAGGDMVRQVAERAGAASRGAMPDAAGLDRLAQGKPLLFGALGLALGAALGAVLPRTRAEDEWMGEAREALTGQVRGLVGDSYEQLRTAAGTELERASDAALGAYQQVRERVERDGIGAAGEVVTEAARDVARTAGEAVRNVAAEIEKGAQGRP